MSKVIELAREAGFSEWENTDSPEFLGVIERFYTLARADLNDLVVSLEAENAQLLKVLEAVYTTCDWHTDDGKEAMQAARAALGETK